jgi:hypothetical protein
MFFLFIYLFHVMLQLQILVQFSAHILPNCRTLSTMNPIVGIVTSTQSCNDISYYPCVVLHIEVMFEKYNFGVVFIQIQVVLTLYA